MLWWVEDGVHGACFPAWQASHTNTQNDKASLQGPWIAGASMKDRSGRRAASASAGAASAAASAAAAADTLQIASGRGWGRGGRQLSAFPQQGVEHLGNRRARPSKHGQQENDYCRSSAQMAAAGLSRAEFPSVQLQTAVLSAPCPPLGASPHHASTAAVPLLVWRHTCSRQACVGHPVLVQLQQPVCKAGA